MLDLWENVIYLRNSKILEDDNIKCAFKINMKSAYLIIISIYKQFSDDQIRKIHYKITSMNDSFYYVLVRNSKIMNFKARENYVSYYKSKIDTLSSLTNGITKSDLML